MGATPIQVYLLLGAVSLLVCVLASKLSAKIGVPALVLFIAVGMLAGSEGPGGIAFDNFKLTKELGMVLLAFIIFAGGMDTEWEAVRPVALQGLSLATIGVAITAGLVGAFADLALGFTQLEGLLLGAIVSCTDAAATFSILRAPGLALERGMGARIEFESGANDPVAVFLTLGLTRAIVDPNQGLIGLLPSLAMQMPLGAIIGFGVAKATVWLINRVRLEYDGLYPMLTLSCAGVSYGLAYLFGGNEFLAVYVAGLVLGSSVYVHKISLRQFHDGLAWLLQIAVFLALGLLVFPGQLAKVIGVGILLAAMLMFVARPIAVFVSLAASRLPARSKLFVSWAGLRGAFPIILGSVPVLAGLQQGNTIFHLVFFVVVASVLVQGTTLRMVGRALGVVVPASAHPDLQPATTTDLLEIALTDSSPAAGKQVAELGLPATALLVLLRREGESYIPRGATILVPGDSLLVATRREDQDELRVRLAGPESS